MNCGHETKDGGAGIGFGLGAHGSGPRRGVSRGNSICPDVDRSHRRMLELAEVKKGDVLYDLGSGDGRIVIRAAKKYGIRAVGIEMDRLLLDQARRDAKSAGVTHLVEFRSEDALKANISKATVITLYMLPWFNEAMKPSFAKQLKPGSRIVAHDFGIAGWEPDQTVKLPGYELKPGGYKHQHTLYLWKMSKHRN